MSGFLNDTAQQVNAHERYVRATVIQIRSNECVLVCVIGVDHSHDTICCVCRLELAMNTNIERQQTHEDLYAAANRRSSKNTTNLEKAMEHTVPRWVCVCLCVCNLNECWNAAYRRSSKNTANLEKAAEHTVPRCVCVCGLSVCVQFE